MAKKHMKRYSTSLIIVVWLLSHVQLFCGPKDCSPPGSFVHGIFQQKYWSRLPFPSPGDLPDPGIEPRSAALQADSLPFELIIRENNNQNYFEVPLHTDQKGHN
ncbi:unnamed protein product [Rangifer tarandus platyrhynchus]|uniref:Uncharacterized protein n=1 Tax=Rangifer tarandus platyrhynchus TaxID=3082113 RepID=A0ABN8ZU04_RANTA|nr:unnamed protein product [Rangifer tarandus platyrhynchus]